MRSVDQRFHEKFKYLLYRQSVKSLTESLEKMYVLVYSKTGKNLFLTRTQIKEKSDNNTCYPKPHARISINTPNHRNHFTPWVTMWRNIIYHKINTPVHLISIASDAEDSRWTRCKQNIEGKSRKTHAHVEDLFALTHALKKHWFVYMASDAHWSIETTL